MKSQSSLEVPKQVRSASFDEIQLEAQRQESRQQAEDELRSIAKMAMLTSRTGQSGPNSGSLSSGSSSFSGAAGATTLKIPQLHSGQRSKSVDVQGERVSKELLERSSSTGSSYPRPIPTNTPVQQQSLCGPSESSAQPSSGSQAQSQSPRNADTPVIQVSGCYHCACVEEYKIMMASRKARSSEESETTESDALDDDWDEEVDLGLYRPQQQQQQSSSSQSEMELGRQPLKIEHDQQDNSYYVVVHDPEVEDEGSDCSRRDGSPEIRVTLSNYSAERTSSDMDPDSSEASEPPAMPPGYSGQRRLSRQEALTTFPLELPAIVGTADKDKEQEQQQQQQQQQVAELISQVAEIQEALAGRDLGDEQDEEEEEEEYVDEEDDDDEAETEASLIVGSIFLTVPDVRRDRAASVDSCFNQSKNGNRDTSYSLQVPQQSVRSKSVDIVLPTDVQTRYTALLPGSEEARALFVGYNQIFNWKIFFFFSMKFLVENEVLKVLFAFE